MFSKLEELRAGPAASVARVGALDAGRHHADGKAQQRRAAHQQPILAQVVAPVQDVGDLELEHYAEHVHGAQERKPYPPEDRAKRQARRRRTAKSAAVASLGPVVAPHTLAHRRCTKTLSRQQASNR